jgi:hypothetical protein
MWCHYEIRTLIIWRSAFTVLTFLFNEQSLYIIDYFYIIDQVQGSCIIKRIPKGLFLLMRGFVRINRIGKFLRGHGSGR